MCLPARTGGTRTIVFLGYRGSGTKVHPGTKMCTRFESWYKFPESWYKSPKLPREIFPVPVSPAAQVSEWWRGSSLRSKEVGHMHIVVVLCIGSPADTFGMKSRPLCRLPIVRGRAKNRAKSGNPKLRLFCDFANTPPFPPPRKIAQIRDPGY